MGSVKQKSLVRLPEDHENMKLLVAICDFDFFAILPIYLLSKILGILNVNTANFKQ